MHNDNIVISIVVPVYNVEIYLDKCIKSIVGQSYRNLEIILVDDGSTDNSLNICNFWIDKDERIKIIHKKNGGLSSARNAGIDIATGDYIAFVDSDDYIDNEFVAKLLNKMLETDSDIVCCGYYEIINGERNISNKKLICGEYTKKEALEMLIKWDIQDYAWNKLYRRSLFENIRYPEGRNYEDMATTYKIFLKANKVTVIGEKLYNYLIRKGSISNTDNNKRYIKDMRDTIEIYNERIGNISLVYSEFKILTIEQMMDRIDFFLNIATLEDVVDMSSRISRYVKPYVKLLCNSREVPIKRKFKIFIMYAFPKQYINFKLRIGDRHIRK